MCKQKERSELNRGGAREVLCYAGETLAFTWLSGIHVDVTLTRTAHINTGGDHIHPIMATVFSDGRDLFQQENTLCYSAKKCSGRV